MNTMKGRDVAALGFMTFALFVGAGNIILPPFIALEAGQNVWVAALGFLATAVGLPVITIIAIAKAGGSMFKLSQPIGKVASLVLAFICYLMIGPLFAGPRTAAVSFEIGVMPFLSNPKENTQTALFIYSFIYFAIVLVVALYPGRMLDSVGHFLAPLKMVALAILGVAAFVAPVGEVGEAMVAYQEAAFAHGFVNGYLTMDTLASLAFGILVVNAIRSRNIESTKLIVRYAVIAGLIAGVGLTLVYISLFKLGSNSSPIAMGADNGAAILQAYVVHTFGNKGAFFLSALIGIACLVTAIGVTTACGAYFSLVLPISHRTIVIIIAIFSFGVSNFGLTKLLQVSLPILTAIHPPCIVLVLLSFVKRLWHSPSRIFAPVMLMSFFFGIFDGLRAAKMAVPDWLSYFPFAEENMAWLIPSFAVLIVATIVDRVLGEVKHKQISEPEAGTDACTSNSVG